MKKLFLIVLSVLMCLSFASCDKGGGETPTDVPTEPQQGLWTQKVNEIGATVENEQIVCYDERDTYIEFLAAVYSNGARVSETVYRIYYDKDLYETEGKAAFKDKPGYAYDDTVWFVQYNSSFFKGENYSKDIESAYAGIDGRYQVKVPLVGY